MGERKSVIMFALGSGLIIGVNKGVKGGVPKPRVFLGLMVAFILLGFLAEFAPELAVMFAALVFVSVALSQGPQAFNGLSKALHK